MSASPKSAEPATADAGREAHASVRFGNRERREATTNQTRRLGVSVYDGRSYCGRVQQVDAGRWLATTHTGDVVGTFKTHDCREPRPPPRRVRVES